MTWAGANCPTWGNCGRQRHARAQKRGVSPSARIAADANSPSKRSARGAWRRGRKQTLGIACACAGTQRLGIHLWHLRVALDTDGRHAASAGLRAREPSQQACAVQGVHTTWPKGERHLAGVWVAVLSGCPGVGSRESPHLWLAPGAGRSGREQRAQHKVAPYSQAVPPFSTRGMIRFGASLIPEAQS